MPIKKREVKLNLPHEALGPAIDGTIFYECDDAPKPILSLIWLPLIEGTDFCDEAQASTRIWYASLDYVACLPGCEKILWGCCLGSDGFEVLLVIRWRSVSAWSAFQSSPGVQLLNIAGLLRESPLNKTICSHAMDWDAKAAGKIIECTLYSSGPGSCPSPSEQSSLESLIIRQHIQRAKTKSIGSHIAIVERYGAFYPRSKPKNVLAETLSNTLASITLWEREEDYLASTKDDNLIAIDKSLKLESPNQQQFAAKLRLFTPTPPEIDIAPLPPATSWAGLHKMSLPRQRGCHPQGKPRPGLSTARMMGRMNEYNLQVYGLALTYLMTSRKRRHTLEIIRFNLASTVDGYSDPHGPICLAPLLKGLREQLAGWAGYVAVNFCRAELDAYPFELLLSMYISPLCQRHNSA